MFATKKVVFDIGHLYSPCPLEEPLALFLGSSFIMFLGTVVKISIAYPLPI
jgi:hypothetical protein